MPAVGTGWKAGDGQSLGGSRLDDDVRLGSDVMLEVLCRSAVIDCAPAVKSVTEKRMRPRAGLWLRRSWPEETARLLLLANQYAQIAVGHVPESVAAVTVTRSAAPAVSLWEGGDLQGLDRGCLDPDANLARSRRLQPAVAVIDLSLP